MATDISANRAKGSRPCWGCASREALSVGTPTTCRSAGVWYESHMENPTTEPVAAPLSSRACPRCGEGILDTAIRCRFCGQDLRPRHQRGRTWAAIAGGLSLLVAGVGIFVVLKPPSDVEVVRQALDCSSLKDDGEPTSMNDIGLCITKRSAQDFNSLYEGQQPKWGLEDGISEALDCATLGDKDEPEVTAKCLIDSGLVSR